LSSATAEHSKERAVGRHARSDPIRKVIDEVFGHNLTGEEARL
jgi:hypothetical protein